MNIEEVRSYCLNKPGTTESFPFDEDTLVFKVMGKMFALIPLEKSPGISLKCDPEYAIELRAHHPGLIEGAYHMNKKHWNMVSLEGNLTNDLIRSLIDHSYELVVSKLKKADREKLKDMS
ncbi:MAG: MmcQ/YjbR family DNA-binding protein [Bacteroidia bacterium]|nr:MmcQ/YjbR family DNA-binding protein [Bacteroidia bacterium]